MPDLAKGKTNINAFSYARAVACAAIVLLHTVFVAVSLFGDEATQFQVVGSKAVVNSMMWAVPCFLMVSGALLLDPKKELTIRKIFSKYILRVFLAIVCFILLYRFLEAAVNREPISIEVLLSGLYKIFTGTSWSHMWYLYLLIGLYLLLPFYKKITAHCTAGEIKYLLLIYLIFLSLLPVLGVWNLKSGFYITVSSIYPFYFFCGWAIYSGAIEISRRAAAVMTVLGTAAVVGFTLLRWLGGVEAADIFYGYSSIFVIMQAVGIFTLITRRRERKESPGIVGRVLLELDSCSFGVYLIHLIFVRYILKHTAIHPYESLWILPGLTLGILLLSYLITRLLKMLPPVRKIL